MYRFKVAISAHPLAGSYIACEVYMFAATASGIHSFFAIVNPYINVVVTQVGDASIGI